MDKFEQLLGIVTQEEKAVLSVLHNACVANLKTYNEERTDSALRNWKSAETEKASRVEAMWQKYSPETQLKYFKNILAAVGWLQEHGYKVKRATVYKAGKAGKLRVEPDGRVSELAVQAYAAGLKKRTTELDLADQGEKASQKIEEEIRGLRLKNERQQIELDTLRGKYILRSDLEMELSSRVMVFEAGLRHFIITQAPALVDACAGDRNLVPAVQILLNTELDRQLTAMADVERFQVIMVADEVGGVQGSGDGVQGEEEELEADVVNL